MTAAPKITFDKNWLNEKSKTQSKSRKVHKFEQMRVIKSEDLPQLMTTNEAAEFLKRHPKTVEEYRKDGALRFIKIRGRYFTTPEYIADFIRAESMKK